jgi:hypothetical protein
MSFRCKTNARKLLIIKLSEPRPYALLPGIVLSLNKVYAPGLIWPSGIYLEVRPCLATKTG